MIHYRYFIIFGTSRAEIRDDMFKVIQSGNESNEFYNTDRTNAEENKVQWCLRASHSVTNL